MYNLFIDSPVGILEIICNEKFLLKIIPSEKMKNSNPNNLCHVVKKELEEYFRLERKKFTIPIKFSGTTFEINVYTELNKLTFGELISYKELANRINRPKAVRAVAAAVGSNKILIIIPCHRIIGSDETMTGYMLGIDNKIKLLEKENHIIIKKDNNSKSKVNKTKLV